MSSLLDSIIEKDKELLIFLNNLGTEQWDNFWLFITNQLNWTPLFLLIFFLTIKKFDWKRGGFAIFSMILLVAISDQTVNFIKNATERLRPINNPEINHLLRVLIEPQSYSFISGHATTSTFFSIFVILILRERFKYIYFVLIFPLIFGYSRLYLGVHFPIDIFTGFLTGFLFAKIYFFLYQKADKRLFI